MAEVGPFHGGTGLSACTGKWAAWPSPSPGPEPNRAQSRAACELCVGHTGAGQGPAGGGAEGQCGMSGLCWGRAAPHSACTEPLLPVGRWGRAVLQRGRHTQPHAAGLGAQNPPGTQRPAVLCSPCLAPRCPPCCSVTAPPQQDGGENTTQQFLA